MLCVCTCHIAKKIFSQILSRTSFKIRLRVGSEHTHESEVARDNQMHQRKTVVFSMQSPQLNSLKFVSAMLVSRLACSMRTWPTLRSVSPPRTYHNRSLKSRRVMGPGRVLASVLVCAYIFVCLCICRTCSKISILLWYHPLPCIPRVLWTPWQVERAVAHAGSS